MQTKNLKGLVLAGGKGSRLRPLTATGAKQLVPVANKPVLFYALEQMIEAGITDIGIITGDTGDQVREALGNGSAFGARFTFIPQDAPLGLAHAVATGREFLGDDPFCMYLGDNFLKNGIISHAERYRSNGAQSQILLKRVEDPRAVGVAVLDDGGRVVKLVEKPQTWVSDLAVIGVYFFGPEIHEITPTLTPSARGELEITDAIQGLVDAGYNVDASIIDDAWIDTGKKDDMLEANRVVLGTVSRKVEGEVDETSAAIGNVVIEPGAIVRRSVVRGPVVIGAGTVIEDAYVGPFTAIGPDCRITHCEIEHSIVLERSEIRDIHPRISDSLIGKDVEVHREDGLPRTIQLLLGDHSKVGLI